MKSVIIFYMPYIMGSTEVVTKLRREMHKNFRDELVGGELAKDFHMVFIEDSSRTKIETEVFFKPEK